MSDDRILSKTGGSVPDDNSHAEINPSSGQQKDYIVLSPEARKQGFVRPVRWKYTHLACGTHTGMSNDIAETYARNPKFYSGTFCFKCRKHFSLTKEDGQPAFVWEDGQPVGS